MRQIRRHNSQPVAPWRGFSSCASPSRSMRGQLSLGAPGSLWQAGWWPGLVRVGLFNNAVAFVLRSLAYPHAFAQTSQPRTALAPSPGVARSLRRAEGGG